MGPRRRRGYPKIAACSPKPIVALKTAWMVSNSKPLTAVSTNGKIIRPTGSMMLATKATHRSLVTIGCFAATRAP